MLFKKQSISPKRRELIFRFLDLSEDDIIHGRVDQRLLNLAYLIDGHVKAEELFRYCIQVGLVGNNILDKVTVDHEGVWLLGALNSVVNMYENSDRPLYADRDFGDFSG